MWLPIGDSFVLVSAVPITGVALSCSGSLITREAGLRAMGRAKVGWVVGHLGVPARGSGPHYGHNVTHFPVVSRRPRRYPTTAIYADSVTGFDLGSEAWFHSPADSAPLGTGVVLTHGGPATIAGNVWHTSHEKLPRVHKASPNRLQYRPRRGRVLRGGSTGLSRSPSVRASGSRPRRIRRVY